MNKKQSFASEVCEHSQVVFPAVLVITQLVTVMVTLKWSWSVSVEMPQTPAAASYQSAAALAYQSPNRQLHPSLAITPPTAALSGLQSARYTAARPTWAHRDHRHSIPTAFHRITALLESHQQANLANFTALSKNSPAP